MNSNPVIMVVAGVSGSGKTTVGRRLAERMGAAWLEGDDLHSDANIAKMRSGAPLEDADRLPWLKAIGARIDAWIEAGQSGVVACSALKSSYRAMLLGEAPPAPQRLGRVQIALLQAPVRVLESRIAGRKGHFMPLSLLPSQLKDLEPIGPDESRTFAVDASGTPEDAVQAILARVR